MKKNIAFFVLLLCGMVLPGIVKAQPAGKVTITNTTGCELHLQAVGSLSACGISSSYISTIISSAGTVVFDVSAGIPGWASGPALITGIRMYPVTVTCGGSSIPPFLYGSCPGFNLNALAYSVSSLCIRCSYTQFNGTYTPPPVPGGDATLVFF